MNAKAKALLNKKLTPLLKQIYFKDIPLQEIFDIFCSCGYQLVQEDAIPWSGFLCGRESIANFNIKNLFDGQIAKYSLNLQWYEMPSGKYEITAYVG